jgi:hypothetical protein
MALACRFCHPDPVQSTPSKASYAIALTYGTTEKVELEVSRIEAMQIVVPGHCIQCEECHRYSMISYALACYIHGEAAEKDKTVHYANLCTSCQMVTQNGDCK